MLDRVYVVFDYNPETGNDDIVAIFYLESSAKEFVESHRKIKIYSQRYYEEHTVE